MIDKIQYNASNDSDRIAREDDSFVALDSGRPNEIVMGKEKTCKRKPNQEINVTKNAK